MTDHAKQEKELYRKMLMSKKTKEELVQALVDHEPPRANQTQEESVSEQASHEGNDSLSEPKVVELSQ